MSEQIRLLEDYREYQWFVVLFALHAFLTTFFCLWPLAAGLFGKELVASKCLHGLFCIASMHWWVAGRYPVLELKIMDHRMQRETDRQNFSTPELGTRDSAGSLGGSLRSFGRSAFKSKNRALAKIFLMFFLLLIGDLLFLCIRVVPVVVTCIKHWDTGESIPAICRSRDSKHWGSPETGDVLEKDRDGFLGDQQEILYLTIFVCLLQIVLELVVICYSLIKFSAPPKLANKR